MSEKMIAWSKLNEDSPLYPDFTPPNVDAERIVLNTRRLRLTQRLGMLGQITLTRYEGPADEVSFGIGNIQSDGSAVATKGKITKPAPNARLHIHREEVGVLGSSYATPTAEIALNRTTLSSRISDKVQQGESREQAWAHELDQRVRQELRMLALMNTLASGDTMEDESIGAYLLYAASFWISPEFVSTPSALANTGLIYSSIYGTLLLAEKYNRYPLRQRYWSIVPMPMWRVDRLSLSVLPTLPPNLIKCRD